MEDILLKVNEQKDDAVLKKWLLEAAKLASFDDCRENM